MEKLLKRKKILKTFINYAIFLEAYYYFLLDIIR